MELRQLEYFVAVAEETTFTRAAARVNISQPGISAQVRQLERDLGADLLDRSGRTVRLSPAGEAALEHARAALSAAAAVRQAVGDITAVLRGRLTVGMATGCTVRPLFSGLASFHDAHPGIELALSEDTSERLVDHVRAGTVDLALVGTAGRPRGTAWRPIVSERLIALAPPGHPLLSPGRATLGRVADHPIVCMPRGTGIRTVFDRACAARGIEPTIAVQASAAEAIADLAASGIGVAILSESMAAGFAGDLRSRVIEDVTDRAELGLVWSSTPGPALSRLAEHVDRAFGPRPD